MILPRKWIKWRPGFFIPVFFLSFSAIRGQDQWMDASSAAMGRSYVSHSSEACAGLNQAGLGRTDQSSVSLHHIRPFIVTDLDITSLSAQFTLGNGAPGFVLSTMGIRGMRQSSLWLSYGMELYPGIYSGAGVHLRNTGLVNEAFFYLEGGYALGLQFQINEKLMLGAHVTDPSVWQKISPGINQPSLMISTGFSYFFFKTAKYHSEIHIRVGASIIWCNGLEIIIGDTVSLFLGLSNQPWSLSMGFSLKFRKWQSIMAGSYCMDTGATPHSSLSYVW